MPPLQAAFGRLWAISRLTWLSLRHFYQQASIANPSLTVGIARFIQQCVYPNAEQYPQMSITSLQASTNLASVLFDPNNLPTTNAGFVTMQVLGPPGVTITSTSQSPCSQGIGGQSCTESCNTAQTDLSNAYNNFLGGSTCSQAVMAATTKQDSTPLSNCVAAADSNLAPLVGSAGVPNGTTSTGTVTANTLTNAANFGSSYISQVYLNCLVSAGWQMGMNQGVGKNGDVSLPDSYCVITSNQQNQYNVENAASANMFVSNMTAMMSILQFLFYALAPLSAAVMLFAGAQGVGIFTKYLMFGLWTQSWFPVAAVLNNYGQMTASEMLTKYGIALSAGGTPSATTLLSGNNLPFVIEHVSKILANVDMMMALTPVITMIVFTGSYMAMSGLAQDINGEVQNRGALGSEAPGLAKQEKAFGVSAPGNAAGSYITTDGAYNGAGFSYGSALSAGVSAAEQRAATATGSYTQSVGHQASYTMGMMNQYGEDFKHTAAFNTKGGHELSNAWKTMQGFATDAKISSDQLANYAAQYKGQLNLGASPAQALATVMSRVKQAFGQAAGGLTGSEENKIANAIQNSEVQKAANDLTSGESAKLITEASRQLGVDKAEKDSQSLNQQVSDTKNAQATAQNAISQSDAIKQEAQRQSSVSGSEQINQGVLSAKAASNGQALNDGLATQIALRSADPTKALSEYRNKRDWLSAHTSMSGEALTSAALTLAGSQDAGNLGVAIGQYVYGESFGGQIPQAVDALNQRVNTNYNKGVNTVTAGANSLIPAETHANTAENQVPGAVQKGLDKGQKVKHQAISTTNAHTPEGEYAAGAASVNTHKVGSFSPQFQKIAKQVQDAPAMPVLKWAQEHPEEYVALLAATNAAGPLASLAADLGKKAWGALKSFGPAAAGAGAAAAGAGEAAAGAAVAAGAGEAAAGAAAASAAGAGATATVATLGATVVAGAAAAVGVGVAGGVGLAIGAGLNYAPKLFGSNETLSDMLAGGADQLLHGDTASGKVWQEGYNKAIQTPQYKENQAKIKDLMASGATMDNPEVKSLVQDNVQLINGTVADIVNPPPRDGAVVPAI